MVHSRQGLLETSADSEQRASRRSAGTKRECRPLTIRQPGQRKGGLDVIYAFVLRLVTHSGAAAAFLTPRRPDAITCVQLGLSPRRPDLLEHDRLVFARSARPGACQNVKVSKASRNAALLVACPAGGLCIFHHRRPLGYIRRGLLSHFRAFRTQTISVTRHSEPPF